MPQTSQLPTRSLDTHHGRLLCASQTRFLGVLLKPDFQVYSFSIRHPRGTYLGLNPDHYRLSIKDYIDGILTMAALEKPSLHQQIQHLKRCIRSRDHLHNVPDVLVEATSSRVD